ncbi:MAG: flagellar hook-basal body complex protein [Oscillospiraceae bacterium]|jgi:flagellar basal body rod protein FlgG|nr:flagellar hook-basal body complex protein [Oscillospiraceae bacterium]
MFRGFYNAAQAMIIHQRKLDSISNNVLHVNTAGYRKDEIVTNTFMEELILVRGRTRLSGTFQQTYVQNNKVNLEQSNFEYTESRFDMAVWGNVYFNIRTMTENPNVYQTRNGQFELDNEGYLVLGRAGRVQGQNGDIYIGSDDFIVEPDGVIRNNDGIIDALLLTYIPPDADVAKISDTLFSYTGGEELPAGEGFDIIQGAFEKSNVDVNKEMTRAMEIQRLYEANSKMLQYIDTLNARSVSLARAGNAN